MPMAAKCNNTIQFTVKALYIAAFGLVIWVHGNTMSVLVSAVVSGSRFFCFRWKKNPFVPDYRNTTKPVHGWLKGSFWKIS